MKIDVQKEFKLGISYLKDSKRYIYFVVFIFLLGLLAGYFSFFLPGVKISHNFGNPESFQQNFYDTDFVDFPNLSSYIRTSLYYFFNNFSVFLFIFVTGIFFCILPLFVSFKYGNLFWFVSLIYEGKIFYIYALLPHGIFEFAAMFISLALGLKLGTIIFRKNMWEKFKEYSKGSIRVFIFIVLPLTFIAALIEPISFEIVKFFYQMFN